MPFSGGSGGGSSGTVTAPFVVKTGAGVTLFQIEADGSGSMKLATAGVSSFIINDPAAAALVTIFDEGSVQIRLRDASAGVLVQDNAGAGIFGIDNDGDLHSKIGKNLIIGDL